MDNAQSDWSALELFLITVIAFAVGLAGCGPIADSFAVPAASATPSELLPFQGKWKYDEARSHGPEGEASSHEMSAEEKALLSAMKTLGVVMSDIEIRGTQITQLGGLLRAQYDLLDYKSEGGKIVGTALWHEDRHDPGDATEVKVTLQRDGDTLIFTRDEDGEMVTYYFYK